ncbi:hypothetical protein LLT7_14120 [Lactococcus cremoris subsp. cremoris TIFN7]|jgi:hypothetical protein|nr:hypothetical protein LLT7_14120 [Lactococcus cremoris subsp. cremoris TIFN7]
MVLKLLAILPSGSAGKFLKKIWNLEKWGGTTTPLCGNLVIWSKCPLAQ